MRKIKFCVLKLSGLKKNIFDQGLVEPLEVEPAPGVGVGGWSRTCGGAEPVGGGTRWRGNPLEGEPGGGGTRRRWNPVETERRGK